MPDNTINYYCINCKKLVAIIKEGSKLKKNVVFLCSTCYDTLQSGNMFSDIFKGFGGKK